jgi:hypothetical protein
MLYVMFSLMVIIIYISVPLERAIIVKEQFNNWYKLRTYYMAVTISSLPVQVSGILTWKDNVLLIHDSVQFTWEWRNFFPNAVLMFSENTKVAWTILK